MFEQSEQQRSDGVKWHYSAARNRRAEVALVPGELARHALEQLDRDARLLAHEGPEVPGRHAPADDVRVGAHRRRAIASGEQRDLAEMLAAAERDDARAVLDTTTVPDCTKKKPTPPSPSETMCSPAENARRFIDVAITRRSLSDTSERSATPRRKS